METIINISTDESDIGCRVMCADDNEIGVDVRRDKRCIRLKRYFPIKCGFIVRTTVKLTTLNMCQRGREIAAISVVLF